MSVELVIQCPKCQTRLKYRGEAGSRVVLNCPKCQQKIQTTIPAQKPASSRQKTAVSPPATSARGTSPARRMPVQQASDPLQSAQPYRPPRAATKSSSSSLPIAAILGVGTAVAVLALLGAGAFLFLSGREEVGPVAMDVTSGTGDSVGSSTSDTSLSGNANAPAIVVSSIKPMTPEQIVDEWFQIREASEEGQRVEVLEKGTPAYEERVKRMIEGEKRSRELMRVALASPTGDPALQESIGERNRAFFDKYMFGSGNQQTVASEHALSKDPRIGKRFWKDAMQKYVGSALFPLSKPSQFKASKIYLEFIETLDDVAKRVNQYEAEGQPDVVHQELAKLNDQLIEIAIKGFEADGYFTVPKDHADAEQAFLPFINGTLDELVKSGPDREEAKTLQKEFEFAHRQFEDSTTRNVASLRRQWAELKNPQLKADREQAEKLAAAAKRAESEAKQRESDENRQQFRDAMRGGPRGSAGGGRSGGMPSGLRDRFGNRGSGSGPRGGPRGGPGGGGEMSSGGSRSFSDGFMLRIEGDRDTKAKADAMIERLGSQLYSYSRSGSTTVVLLKWTGAPEEIASEIDFGKVTRTAEKLILVDATEVP
ncbi:hypothetical protein [Rhodopirellula bahusiensis]|uniref:Zinc finger/thioredoxin putative domain-containing protein n=1 Tax=Rhodopirellula bahusiensis TaxID=2014065 RepID=A0A2G1VYG8_9BACT|nr:hypothetical protein [Rhodopirellula bahusiensis]PHQ31812.1 hypothetical protein CEE69_28980 [Rhodopirellula bahusiensis]